jgi:hypothetical protein
MNHSIKAGDYWPLAGIGLSVGLFFLAASEYPGGTTESATTIGYDWAHNFLCSLFAQQALNGAANPARAVAIPAMFVSSVCVGALFKTISGQCTSKLDRKLIEIGGVGGAVYAFLVVTPLHDLMVGISLCFALTALLTILRALYLTRQWELFSAGGCSVLALLLTAAMYYGDLFFGFLPVMQKLSLTASVAWVVAVRYAGISGAQPDAQADSST